jgi:hypothetical protein
LSKGLPWLAYRGQVASAALLALAGILTLFELRPRKYDFFSPSNGFIEKRLEQLREHYKEYSEAETIVQNQMIQDQIGWAKKAISKNQEINKRKGMLVDWSFWLTTVATIINLLTLLHFF